MATPPVTKLRIERVSPPSSMTKEIELLDRRGYDAPEGFDIPGELEIAHIGRTEICDWFGQLDSSEKLSRKHLRIVLLPILEGSVDSVRISDVGSTNGSSPDQAYADVGGIGTPPGSEPAVAEIVLAGVVTLRFSMA